MRLAVLLVVIPVVLVAYVGAILLVFDVSRPMVQCLLLFPLAYVLGSIPWGFLIIRSFLGIDIRKYGSGRIGTTNVLRTAGPRIAALVLILDVSKGSLGVALAMVVADSALIEVVVALLIISGHNWPFFLGFRGGRGIGPGAGTIIIISPVSIVVGLVVFTLTVFMTKYVSLSSLASVLTVFLVVTIQVILTNFSTIYMIYIAIGGLIIFWQHKDNIYRLSKGTERRLGRSANKHIEQG